MKTNSIQQGKPTSGSLHERHIVNRCPLYFKPAVARFFSDKHTEEWLANQSISHDQLVKYFAPSRYAAAVLGLRQASLLGLIRKGKLGRPLYDYSQYSGFDHYVLWVSKADIRRHQATRRGGGRPRES